LVIVETPFQSFRQLPAGCKTFSRAISRFRWLNISRNTFQYKLFASAFNSVILKKIRECEINPCKLNRITPLHKQFKNLRYAKKKAGRQKSAGLSANSRF
jgi:hypothetical protein